MRISGLIKNDVVNGIDVCVSLWTQGCPFHCSGCHNPQTWDFDGGYEINDLKGTIIKAISENNVIRNFSILGGEPLCPENLEMVQEVISAIRAAYSHYNIKIFIWSGYTLRQLEKRKENEPKLNYILSNIDYLIDGPFIDSERDITLWLRGSKNQNIYKNINNQYILINDGDNNE